MNTTNWSEVVHEVAGRRHARTISFVWTLNVKRVAFGCMADRLAYSFGACLGTATGLLVAQLR